MSIPPSPLGDPPVSTDPQPIDDAAVERQMQQALNELDRPATPQTPAVGDENAGGRIRGRIVGIRDQDVFVDFGGKSEGVISLAEFEAPPENDAVFDFVPHGFDADSGQMRFSLSETKLEADWSSVQVGDVIEAKVTGTNIGGIELNIHGIRAFMPKSQVDIERHEDFGGFVGRRLECEITEVNRRQKTLLVSRRRVLERRLAEQREQAMATLEAGQTRPGKVKRLVDFGAFVDIGDGVEGLLHVSDISYARIEKPTEVLKVGDEIQVKVLKLDQQRGRISLGMKQLKPDPWTLVEANYRAGATLDGRVTRLADFGAFVELEPGIEGLIPMSEMSWTQRVRHPRDVVNPGDSTRVQVLSVDPAKRRISLSLRALTEDPWKAVSDKFPADSVVTGTVARLAQFGAFVDLGDGVEGLVHISEVAQERIRSVGDKLKEGDQVQCRVLGVDPEQRRISLSIKRAAEPIEPEAQAESPKQQKRRKERPLRGGLSW